jgi:ABC-type multidrug transport system ATPase subunit
MNGVDLIIRKDKARRMLGYLPQEFDLYPTLTAEQMLDYFARLKGVTDKKQHRGRDPSPGPQGYAASRMPSCGRS